MRTTSTLTTQEKKEKQEKILHGLKWIPLVMLLTVIPLIVRMVVITPDSVVVDTLNQTQVGDLYSNYKATAIVTLSIIMGLIAFLTMDSKQIKWDKTVKGYLIGATLFLGVSFLSTLCSKYSHTAWWGMPDRAEGFIMILCYILMVFYTFYALQHKKDYLYILGGLGFLILISTIIGAFQYFGYDLYTHVDFLRKSILGKEGIEKGYEVTSQFQQGKVFGTMFHYNYMGSFGAMMVPFFMTLTLCTKGIKKKLTLGILMVCAMFLLFGSTSRAGLIGLVGATTVGLILFAKLIIKKWHFTLPVVGILVVILLGFNAMTGGTIFSRIPSLLQESVGLLGKSDETFNYLDHIPVRSITYEEGKQKIVFQDHTLYLENDKGMLRFTDEKGEEVYYMMAVTGDMSLAYTTQDERFAMVNFKTETVTGIENEQAPTVVSMEYKGLSTFCFLLDHKKGVVMVDSCPLEEEEIVFPDTVGFQGKEKLGSARGYIWSRSIPLMKQTLLLGKGPDTYAMAFPQQDYLGKWWAYGTPNMIIDKPHNLYMGIWINNGALALVGFLVVILLYLLQSFKLYGWKSHYSQSELLGIATMTAVVGYLGAGCFNDSVVSVTPIFCILLGAGMGLNTLLAKEK